MTKETSKQVLANLIQANEQIIRIARKGYSDPDLKKWFVDQSIKATDQVKDAKKQLQDFFQIDYDTAENDLIKEGSIVEVLVEHMEGMKGGTAEVKSYDMPAMLSDVTMKNGMVMKNHKWLTNDEVKLTEEKPGKKSM